jgi:hypothetical protein
MRNGQRRVPRAVNRVPSAVGATPSMVSEPWGTWDSLARAALRWAPLLLVAAALLLLLVVAWRFPFFTDEAETLLAAHGVATHGLPIFPSGALFVHGATHSYFLAPLVWLGRGQPDDLFILRATSAILGAITVYLRYRLARVVVGSSAPALLAAALVALDPVSVEWSGLVRMYALEQVMVVVIAWLFVRQVMPESGTAVGSGGSWPG